MAYRKCLMDISAQPFRKGKVGKLKKVFGHGFNYGGTAHRVAYLIDKKKQIIHVIGIGSHERFWEDIKRWFD